MSSIGANLGSGTGTSTVTADHIFENETARDAYFNTPDPHLDELIQDQTPIIVSIAGAAHLQFWTGATNPPTYDNSLWRDDGAITLSATELQTLQTLDSIGSGNVPVKGANGVNFEDSGLRLENGQLITNLDIVANEIISSLNSLRLADQHTISSGAENILFTNNTRRTHFFPVWQGQTAYDWSTNNNQILRGTERVYSDDITQFTLGNELINGTPIPLTGTRTTTINLSYYGIRFRIKEDYVGDLRYESVDESTGIILFDTTVAVNASDGDLVEIRFSDVLGGNTPLELLANQSLIRRVMKEDGNPVLTTPSDLAPDANYLEFPFRSFEDRQIALQDDFQTELVPITSDITITSANLETYNRKTIVSNGASNITIAANVDLDYFDFINESASAVLIAASGTERISGEIDIRFTNFEGGRILKTSAGKYALIYDNDTATVDDLTARVVTLENTAFNSGRAFVTFNDGFTIDRNNIATFADKNIIYTAKNDKPITGITRPDVFLPDDVEIQAANEPYPVSFEFTHLGGTGVFEDSNLLRLFVDGVLNTTLVRDQVAVATKPAVGEPYEIRAAVFDPNNTILPTGVFNLKTDTPITNAVDITTELTGVSIVAGDAYLVTNGGIWAGLDIVDDSVIVALVNNASLADSETNEDWLLLDNPRVNTELTAFLANYVRDGILFNASRNITVDPANVLEFVAMASGTPVERELGANSQGFNRSIRYDNVPIQFTDLKDGRLQLGILFNLTSTSGFAPQWLNMTITYPGGIVFDFPLNGAPINGSFVAEIDIPSVDYTSALNQNASVSLFYNFTGVSFFGSYTINSLVNMSTGRLHQAVSQVAQVEAATVEMRLGARIDQVIGTVDQEDASIESLIPRVSPYENIDRTAPDVFARFLNSTGSDNYPTTVESMTSVSPENPRFTINNVAMYVAVRPQGDKALNNITNSTSIILASSTPNVDLGESLTGADGFVYFIYRVTGLISGNVFEIDTLTQEQVVAWQNSIDNLQGDVERIDAELEHALLNLSDEVVQVFENDVTVTEENTPNTIASDYNKRLSGTNIQAIYPEANPNTFDGNELKSEAINVNIANDRYRNKLIYLPRTEIYTNKVYLNANDGSTTRDLIEYANGTFFAKVFVPAIPSGTVITTIYPGIQNRISGPGIWNTLTTIPVQATEVFFVNDVPPTNTGVTIQYRGHANGNIFGASSIVLPANQDRVDFVLDDGSETATVEVFRRNGQIRVSVTERVNQGLATINDVQVILSYQESRTVPGTPATVRNVPIEDVSADLDNIFAIKPSASGNLIIVGTQTEIDTGYLYTTLFAANESGILNITTDNSIFFDYEDIDIITSTIVSLENHSILPQYGLFTTQYTHETILNLSTQLTVTDKDGNVYNVGDVLASLMP